MAQYLIAALYKFVSLPHFETLREPILKLCTDAGVKGTLLLAKEGINGTIAGPEAGLRHVLASLRAMPDFADLVHKESWSEDEPFYRMKVRLKKEIVTMGVGGIDPNKIVGTYVKPKDWNDLISDPEVVLIDTRNDYEVAIGTFKGAVDPKTKSFREFPAWVEAQKTLHNKPKVAMFCTGGIRCEKSTAYMKEQGFEDVYHLEGGILKYLEEVPADESLWQGECFVFDERVSVGHGLVPGPYDMCRACRRPIDETDKASPDFERGVSCPHCVHETTDEQKARYRERQHQVDLAQARGEAHIGATRNADTDDARDDVRIEGQE
ncbi:rhodanese-related sulfurtransferase [Kordiimonas marina]|uniref:oxygen-dependent tRNA uridine(34) hydroxylase TrhO n=1 Tax=Kordiimonas marina TaxID=2872312 RepID=UPI001FF267A4|nr:rhodanese-related sulfurtransferase [Kordiimonas marina]MCJ9430580.1 rhodanese-related sulfurtransferase [Kordiimonas marina]